MAAYAFCLVPVSPLRAEASDASEMVSQLLFGEPVELLEEQEQWRKVRSYVDHYEGWTDVKHLQFLREKDFFRWLDGLTTEHQFLRRLQTPLGPMMITRGAFVPGELVTQFRIGTSEYVWLDEEADFQEDKLQLAREYLNAPYLWGGKTSFGIDCSGLMQVVHRLYDINLPRDAYQQAEVGMTVAFEDRQAGDLAFFVNTSGKIHHVGMLLSENEIIHASGFVRIDELTREGIVRCIDLELSHRFHSIRRL